MKTETAATTLLAGLGFAFSVTTVVLLVVSADIGGGWWALLILAMLPFLLSALVCWKLLLPGPRR